MAGPVTRTAASGRSRVSDRWRKLPEEVPANDGAERARETLENPARLRENGAVIAGQDRVNGRQAARFHGL